MTSHDSTNTDPAATKAATKYYAAPTTAPEENTGLTHRLFTSEHRIMLPKICKSELTT